MLNSIQEQISQKLVKILLVINNCYHGQFREMFSRIQEQIFKKNMDKNEHFFFCLSLSFIEHVNWG
jgi:hypothetical protein